jgi:hypothetical protein
MNTEILTFKEIKWKIVVKFIFEIYFMRNRLSAFKMIKKSLLFIFRHQILLLENLRLPRIQVL